MDDVAQPATGMPRRSYPTVREATEFETTAYKFDGKGGVEAIDFDAERVRLKREIAKEEVEIGKIDKKLGNEQFVAKAPPEVIDEQRERREDAASRLGRLTAALARLS